MQAWGMTERFLIFWGWNSVINVSITEQRHESNFLYLFYKIYNQIFFSNSCDVIYVSVLEYKIGLTSTVSLYYNLSVRRMCIISCKHENCFLFLKVIQPIFGRFLQPLLCFRLKPPTPNLEEMESDLGFISWFRKKQTNVFFVFPLKQQQLKRISKIKIC